jgi:predicted Zn-dependent peptidase
MSRAALHAALALAVYGLWAAPLGARETPPPPAPPRDFALPQSETIELANGLGATFIEYGEIPKVAVIATVRAGALNQGQDAWLASLTAQMVSEGTATRTASEVAIAAANMGGQLAISAGDDETSVAIDVLSESAPDAINLVADVLIRPALPESEFARVRQDALRGLSVARTQPQALAEEAFRTALYGGHPYAFTLPTEAQLAGYGSADIRRFHAENFGAARTHVYVAGRFDRATVEQAVRSAFGGWARGPDARIDVPETAATREVKLIARPDAPQSTIYLGLPVIDPADPHFMALSVMNTLLGGYFSSRITANIREDKGYTYSPYSSFATRYRDTVWLQVADVTTADTAAAIAEIVTEIERLRAEPPSGGELDAVKNYRNGVFLISNATPEGLAAQLAFMDLHGLPEEWLTTFVDRLYAVTPEQISAAARKYLDPDQMTLIVVGDLAVVRPQLVDLKYLHGVSID